MPTNKHFTYVFESGKPAALTSYEHLNMLIIDQNICISSKYYKTVGVGS